jgi:hypothetical protein
MVSPDATSTEADGRHEVADANPVINSDESCGAPQTNSKEISKPDAILTTRHYAIGSGRLVTHSNSETRRQLLADYPELRSFLLPQPIPIPNFDGEPEISPPPEPLPPESELETVDAPSYSSDVPLRGIKLFSAVFDELSKHLGKEFSSAELMRAAQQLVDLSKDEYVGVIHKDGSERANYYTWDLVRAFISNPWQIASVETHRIDHCDSDEFTPETFQNAKLMLQGWGERTWEF